ncbi:Crp/Fnr family transcriptional regulator [Lacihabitans sp. CCS-44]|uniref:Crp/Fnr family transcriptional regulator n=1 Tax=Lacihabitans sp. CCS-44 TaxID=2487331 RepID=UPI0020CBE059|nr:Crp/Fnr family transcriptional regulator [Lacihabitans sp. CCS-44]MCP9755968.1 Crp/Fnr family transcriptional regulator [Lacihabitans sp. CCS-44]
MLDKLKIFIRSKIEISDEEILQIQPYISTKNYSKNDFIIKEGEYCHFIGFLNSGLIRSYLHDDGKELTTQFIFENCFFTYLEGLLQEISSHKNFVALEDCEALILKKNDLPKILELNPKFESIFRHLLFDESLMQIKANEAERKETPTERYLKFLNQYPTANNRISIKFIASFLGIEPQSLSRIRKRLTQNTKVT